MPKITDPDLLTQSVQVTFDTGSLLIQLSASGELTASAGVSMQALYSFIKEEWKDDDNLIKFPFPMISITTEQFELINGWNFSGSRGDQSGSQAMIRDGGWAVVRGADNDQYTERWMNLTTLGNFDDPSVDQAYYLQAGTTTVDSIFTGPMNEGIQIYASASDAVENFNYTSSFQIYLREQGKTYGFYDLLTEQSLTELTYRKFALPLANGNDTNITVPDTDFTGSPYTSMTITYFTSSQLASVGGTNNFDYKVEINGGGGTKEEIYNWVQYQLRQTDNIDSGDNLASGQTGSIAEELIEFVGSTLRTKTQNDVSGSGAGGVYISNFDTNDTNNLEFANSGGTLFQFDFVAAGTFAFNTFLVNDADAIYKLFFTNDDAGDNTGRDFGTQDAIIIQDSNDNPLTGSVGGSSSLSWDYDFDKNVQRGNASSGSLVPFTAVAVGLSSAQYVVVTGNITRTTGQTITFVAAQERNYSNPV